MGKLCYYSKSERKMERLEYEMRSDGFRKMTGNGGKDSIFHENEHVVLALKENSNYGERLFVK